MIIAIDPGSRGSGVAQLVDGRLYSAWYVPGPAVAQPSTLPTGTILVRGADGSSQEVRCTTPRKLAIELPQVYRPGRAPGNPNDLIQVAVVAGAWGREGQRLGYEVEFIQPARWKGQAPKPVIRDRIRAALDAEELACIEAPALTRGGADVWDAIGIALWSAGRLSK